MSSLTLKWEAEAKAKAEKAAAEEPVPEDDGMGF